ncbi:MAG: hypothetical protein RL093_1724 [Pseudomonadota bacterium]|jgi:hypothetical protein
MSAALALVMALETAALVPAAPQPADVAQLVRDACVETGMRRVDLERLGQARRWRRVRPTSDNSPSEGWNLIYRTGDALVMLSQVPDFGAGDPSTGSVCTVAIEGTAPSLEGDVSALATSLGLGDEAPFLDQPAGFVPMRVWSRFGDHTLTYAAAPDGRATISLSRQVVSTLPAPASPPGN